jgi:hypothetical protein
MWPLTSPPRARKHHTTSRARRGRPPVSIAQLEGRTLLAVSLQYSSLSGPLTVVTDSASFTQTITAPDPPSP